MMFNKKKMVRILLTLTLVLGTTLFIQPANVQAKSYKKVYAKFLKTSVHTVKVPVGKSGYETKTININYYTQLNVDRKGCKELLVLNRGTNNVYVFTVKKGKIKCVGTYWNKYMGEIIRYNKRGLIATDGPGGSGALLFQIKSGRLVEKAHYFVSADLKPKYYINNKRTTKKKESKYEKKYFNGIKTKNMSSR